MTDHSLGGGALYGSCTYTVEFLSFLFNEPVYQFLDRKRAEGKPYLVYMTAGANKFLRIYYGKVKECLRNLEQESNEES